MTPVCPGPGHVLQAVRPQSQALLSGGRVSRRQSRPGKAQRDMGVAISKEGQGLGVGGVPGRGLEQVEWQLPPLRTQIAQVPGPVTAP